jgi:predicted transcriptional regulator
MVRMNITMSDELAERLNMLANNSTKSEILRKALTLFVIAQEGKHEGKKLALIEKDSQNITEIVGL